MRMRTESLSKSRKRDHLVKHFKKMVKLNYLIFAVLICLAIVVSQVRCGGQDCDPSRVGSGIHSLYVEDEEMLNSLMNKKHIVKLTKAGRKNVNRKLTQGRRNSKMLRRLVKRQVARKISHRMTEKRGRIGHSVHNKVSNNNKHAKRTVSNKNRLAKNSILKLFPHQATPTR